MRSADYRLFLGPIKIDNGLFSLIEIINWNDIVRSAWILKRCIIWFSGWIKERYRALALTLLSFPVVRRLEARLQDLRHSFCKQGECHQRTAAHFQNSYAVWAILTSCFRSCGSQPRSWRPPNTAHFASLLCLTHPIQVLESLLMSWWSESGVFD